MATHVSIDITCKPDVKTNLRDASVYGIGLKEVVADDPS
jgi:hypothetical protein